MNIGFIGLGGMGGPMAAHLLAAGHELAVWSRRPASAEFLLAQGACWADSPAALASGCEIVCTNVTGTADVEELAAQLIDGLGPDAIHVDFSTIAPTAARGIAAHDFAAGVEARLHHKDFAATLAEASRQHIPLPVAGAVMQQLDVLMAAGWGSQDTSRLLSVLERCHD